MSISSIDPEKEATYQVLLGSTFTDVPKQNFHALKCISIASQINFTLTFFNNRQFQACRNRLRTAWKPLLFRRKPRRSLVSSPFHNGMQISGEIPSNFSRMARVISSKALFKRQRGMNSSSLLILRPIHLL